MGTLTPFAASPTLLRHRGHIPPFSSYGGILGAVLATAPFFRTITIEITAEPGVNRKSQKSLKSAFGLTETGKKQYNHRLCERFGITEGSHK